METELFPPMHSILEAFYSGSGAQVAIAILAFGFMGLLGIVLRNFDATLKEQNKATKELTSAVTNLQLMIAKEYVTLPMFREFRAYCEGEFSEAYEKISEARDRISRVEGLVKGAGTG